MATHDLVKIFDSSKIRVVWDDELEKYFFSVVDVVGVLTEQQTTRNATIYWAVVKKRLKEEGADELITNGLSRTFIFLLFYDYYKAIKFKIRCKGTVFF